MMLPLNSVEKRSRNRQFNIAACDIKNRLHNHNKR